MSNIDIVISDIMWLIKLKMSRAGIPDPLYEYTKRCRNYRKSPLNYKKRAKAKTK